MVAEEEIPKDFQRTDVGVIPKEWFIDEMCNLSIIIDSLHQTPKFSQIGFSMVRVSDIKTGDLILEETLKVSEHNYNLFTKNYKPKKGNIVLSRVGSYGVSSFVNTDEPFCLGQNTVVIEAKIDNRYLFYVLNSKSIRDQIENESFGTGYKSLSLKNIKELKIPLPPTKAEQTAIATALNDADKLINELEKLISKKKLIKQGAMQELLRPKEGWEVKTLDELTYCLDNLRVPLNDSQRLKMKGDFPYCGANGVLDFINDYKINDNVILIAGDGGYFDEYLTRPIAYRMKGKFWVNNHAHILKAKEGFSQTFIFYSLVHKNILDHLASGTRAKLNKSEMYKMEVTTPSTEDEQNKISKILSDMDSEIESLEKKLDKYKMIKQGMMQNLLTGKIRLI